MRREYGKHELENDFLPLDFGLENNPKIEEALHVATEIHINDKRKVSGEPYVNHCVAVASILKSWGADEDEIVAGLLHDTLEDHPDQISLQIIEELFGGRVAHLVDGVTKLKKKEGDRDEFETMRKVTKESLIEPGVALIKLADRVHNMLESEGMPVESQQRNSKQTLRIFAPLAESFGLWQVKKLLEDLSFRYLDPTKYEMVKKIVDNDPRLSEKFIKKTEKQISEILKMAGVNACVEHQIGGYFEIAEKQKKFGMRADVHPNSFFEITDVISFRVIIEKEEDIADCYKAMGVVRQKFQGRLIREWHNDYLSEPAVNGYSCIHDSYKFDEGNVEIAFVTRERENFNNWGVSSLERGSLTANPERYARKLIFTPKQELVFMKPEATGIDVAYKLNPVLGLRAIGVKIDGKLSTLDSVVPHASVVEIITDINQLMPNPEWLEYCNRATRKMIEQQMAIAERDMEVQRGREMLIEEVLAERGILNMADLDNKILDKLLMELGCWYGLPDLYYKVSYGMDLEIIRRKLDEAGVVRGRYTTLLISGDNRIGISKDVSQIIAENGGDVKNRVEKVDGNEKFMIRILVSVDYRGKKKIEEEIRKRYPESLVV